jgi:hypothetical protein
LDGLNGVTDEDAELAHQAILGRVTLPSGSYSPEDDPDQDGLTLRQEWREATDPFRSDTEGDGLSDQVEVEGGCDPLDARSKMPFFVSARPVVKVSRLALEGGEMATVLARPPIAVTLAPSPEEGGAVAYALPPVSLTRASTEPGETGTVLARPPVTVRRWSEYDGNLDRQNWCGSSAPRPKPLAEGRWLSYAAAHARTASGARCASLSPPRGEGWGEGWEQPKNGSSQFGVESPAP